MQLLSIWNIHQINVFSFPVCKTCIMKHYIIDMQRKKKTLSSLNIWNCSDDAVQLLPFMWSVIHNYTEGFTSKLITYEILCQDLHFHFIPCTAFRTTSNTQRHTYCITKVSLKSINSHPFRDSLRAVYLTLLWITDKFSGRILYIWNWIKYW